MLKELLLALAAVDLRKEGRYKLHDQDVVATGDGWASAILRASQDFYDAQDPYAEIERATVELKRAMETEARRLFKEWGPPTVDDSHLKLESDCGEPPLSVGDRLAWGSVVHVRGWHRGDVVVFIGVEHQDKELPVCLIAGAVPGQ